MTRGWRAAWSRGLPAKTAKFFQALGYQLEFETGHNSGQLRNGDSPYVFIAEVPRDRPTSTRLVFRVEDADRFDPDPIVERMTSFTATHWGTQEMTVRDPDGRVWSVQAPAPS